jgi:hypothetical protein
MEKVLAAGPVIQGDGNLPHRLVLRAFYTDDMPNEFVVHVQMFDGERISFCYGSYFPVQGKGRTDVMSAYEASFKKWQERLGNMCLDLSYDTVFGHSMAVAV